jgi:hypothetical protein
VVDFALKEVEEAVAVTRLHGDTGYIDRVFLKLTVSHLENINPVLHES